MAISCRPVCWCDLAFVQRLLSQQQLPQMSQVFRTLRAGAYTRSLAFDPESEFLASVSAEGTLQIWDMADGKVKYAQKRVAPKVASCCISALLSFYAAPTFASALQQPIVRIHHADTDAALQVTCLLLSCNADRFSTV